MDTEALSAQYYERAQAEREAGATIEINRSLPYVAVCMSNGSEYFMQGEEASDFLDEVDGYGLNCSDANVVLAIAQNW